MSLRGVAIVLGLAAGLAFLIEELVPLAVVPLQADVGVFETRVTARETRQGRALSEEEHEKMRERFRDETLLLQYAREARLDRNAYVDRRLVKKMRFLLIGRAPVPSDGELKAIYDANPQRFIPPGADVPLAFERVKAQLRAMLAGPAARAVIEERVRLLVNRYQIVIED